MTSSVFFKFKSQKEPSRVEFDGTGISVFELKRDIIVKSGLGDGTEFDLAIYNEDGSEEYIDDTTIIPRSTSVVARRLAPIKPGAGRAARYVSGKMPVNAKNSNRKEAVTSKHAGRTSSGAAKMTSAMTEEERMAAMFQAQSEQWSAQQDEMTSQTPVFRPGISKKGGPPPNIPDHEPPAGYICYRCGEKGHWIQVCPTNDDPNFDNKPRVKRTTGIPRSFLTTVEKPVALTSDGTTDDTKVPSGVMVNAEGEFVVAVPDKKSWEKFQAKTQTAAAAQKAAASGDRELQERGLECSIDKRLFIDPMKTPCCEKTYCNDCITNALIESDFTCPNCGSDEVLIDNLKPDLEMVKKIKAYEQQKKPDIEERGGSRSPSVKSETTVKLGNPETALLENSEATMTQLPLPADTSTAKPNSPQNKIEDTKGEIQHAGSAPAGSKKRPADELLNNPKVPKGPKAMQQQENQRQAHIQQQAMMNGMNAMGFPAMPYDMSGQFVGNGYGMNLSSNMNMMNGLMGMSMPPMLAGNTMVNPVLGMTGFPMTGGFPNMSGPGFGGNMNGGVGYGVNMNGMPTSMMGNGNMNGNRPAAGIFPNQQKLANDEDNAYFRKPVNPHRHQGRQRKARPSDYREL